NRGKPIAWYRFDECQGTTAYDASGNGNNGTITIGATGTNTSAGTCSSGTSTDAWNNGTSGKFSGSIDLDGSNDYVTVDSAGELIDQDDFTFAAWIYPHETTDPMGINHRTIYVQNDQAGGYYTHYIFIDRNTGGLSYDNWLPTGGGVSTSTALQKNTWQHVAVVRSSNTVTLYINGIKQTIGAAESRNSFTSVDQSIIGARYYSSAPQNVFDGQIDDVRIYNYPLGDNQIKAIMNEGSAVRFGN
ncbi:MAG: LamG domain-containing protein, partial [Gammaproteobacteria bacterium]